MQRVLTGIDTNVRATPVSALLGMACPPRALQNPPTDSACGWGREHGWSIPFHVSSLRRGILVRYQGTADFSEPTGQEIWDSRIFTGISSLSAPKMV